MTNDCIYDLPHNKVERQIHRLICHAAGQDWPKIRRLQKIHNAMVARILKNRCLA